MYSETDACKQPEYQTEKLGTGLTTAAKVFMIIGTVFVAIFTCFIGLAWCIPMCKYYFGRTRSGDAVGKAFKISSLILVSSVAGILMLCDEDFYIRKSVKCRHVAKTIFAVCFFVMATVAFVPTAIFGAGTAYGLLTHQNGWGNLGYVVLFILFSSVEVILSSINFIFGVLLVRQAFGNQRTFGMVSLVFSMIYVALPLLYVLILYFV